MAFTNTVLFDNKDLPAGEVIAASPHNVSAFDVYENGLTEGRFVKYDAGSVDRLDASATPSIIGIARRKITGEIGEGLYNLEGVAVDQVAEVINLGYASVTVTDAAAPTRYAPVYAINVNSVESGKATQNAGETGAVLVPNVIFWEEKQAGVWLVRMNQYL